MVKTFEIQSISNPDFIDMRIKRNGNLYTMKSINADGLVVKKQFDNAEDLAIEFLGHFKTYDNNTGSSTNTNI